MRIASVRIDYLNKEFPFIASGVEAKPGDIVIVETEFGLDYGLLAEDITECEENEETRSVQQKIVRIATPDDIKQIKSLDEKEKDAFAVCIEEIHSAGLTMKLVSARYSFDVSKVSFCYTADSRVDFRQLVKSLATRLRTRIELRQVGVRDEARLFGGIGPCGRELCCATFLKTFAPVSIRMAKEQGLPLNPLKISGICGRLFCCLKYEFDYYLEARKKMPRVNDVYEHEGKKFRVLSVNVLKTSIFAEDDEGQKQDIAVPIEFTLPPPPKTNCKCGPFQNSADAQDDASDEAAFPDDSTEE